MGSPVSGINPTILIWARERAGLSIAQVAKALGREAEEIQAWESNAGAPTYPQLEALAYRVYKRPVALFFFPEPPVEPDPEHSFHTLPTVEIEDLNSDTRYKIRHARALQLSLYELHGGANPAERKVFVDVPAAGQGPAAAAARVRDYLGIDANTQRNVWKTANDALKSWRDAVEEKGVYVFKNTFKQKDVSGFCLYDFEFPVIYVNNGTAQTRQIFTILHELGHILLGTSGVTKRNDSYIRVLSEWPREVEVFCNQFAGECLLPTSEARKIGKADDATVARTAAAYKVSRQVVLTRLLDLGRVSRAHYERKAAEWAAEYEAQQDEQGGGNYYLTQASYLGERFLRLALGRYYEGAISIEQLADFLNVRVSSVPGLEQAVLQR